VILSPIVAMPIIGLFCNAMEYVPHFVITSTIENIGNVSSSIALFTFGITLGSVKITKRNLTTELLFIIFLKIVVHPMIAFIFGRYVFSLSGYWLDSLMIATSAPTAFFVYLIAQQFTQEQIIDDDFVKRTIALSSVASLISLTAIVINTN
jgi:predicted permease